MTRKVALVTNVLEYAGPPAAAALAEAGWTVFCHDDSFAGEPGRSRFESDNPGRFASAAETADSFVAEGLARFGRVDALISNDIPKGSKPFFEITDLLQDFELYADSLLLEPVRLLRAALPAMKKAGSGSVVLITSGAPLRNPSMGGPHGYAAAREGVHGLVRALASELAPVGIQVNAVAPFLVYSQTFFPSAIGPADPQYAPLVEKLVPMGRFGRPQEIGKLIRLLADGEAAFVSGQVIAFSGAGC